MLLNVFDVQRFCVHDGPGIRTVVFLKGCSLRCCWCQNPESIEARPQIAFFADRCLDCLACVHACRNGAANPQAPRIDRSHCQACGACTEACPSEALRLVGTRLSPEALLPRIEADRPYFETSGGGVTLSGGEPLTQAHAAASLLALCRDADIHTAVETSGAVPWTAFERALPHSDLFLFDLKAAGDELHAELTGSPAQRIIANAERLLEAGAEVLFRMPVVPGLNDGEACLEAMAQLLHRLGRPELTLLRYHRAGEDKIKAIDGDQARLGIDPPSAATALKRAAARLEGRGISITLQRGEPQAHQPQERLFAERVHRLRRVVQSSSPQVCAERAVLVTEYFRNRNNRRKPMLIQKAEAVRHVLTKRGATIWDHELLVGNFSSKRVGGSVFPELHGVAMMEDLFVFSRRQVNPLRLEDAERRALGRSVLPFWLTRFLALRAFSLPRALRFIVDQLRGRRYLINESGGISHLVPDYGALLRLGTRGIAAEAKQRAATAIDDEQREFYAAVQIACEGLEALAAGHAEAARRLARDEADPQRRAELQAIGQVCERVPRLPAETLHQALQSLLFAQIAINQESLDNAVCPGRLDQLLHPYYAADVDAGRLDTQRARELIGCFTVKMSEIVPVFSRRLTRFHGGMFSGQVVVVGGTDRQGNDATNQLTWLFLDAMDELRMRQPNYHARLHPKSPKRYLSRIAAMLRGGSGAPSLMNDGVVVPMLERRGVAAEDARDYSPVGCVEPAACGASFASTDAALVNLALCLERALDTRRGGARTGRLSRCHNIEDLLQRFCSEVDQLVDKLIRDLHAIERANAALHPTPLTSMLLRGCLDSGRDSTAGGARYNSSGVQAVGVADVADSLAAVDQVVFGRRLCTLEQLRAALRADFVGQEVLRAHLLASPKFGNDDPRVDALADRVMTVFSDALGRHSNTRGGPYLAGFYSVTAHVAFGETTGALPSGRRRGTPLANGLSPANGADRLGPTAVLGSVARRDLAGLAQNGINLNLKLDTTSLAGATGIAAIQSLIAGFFQQGGMQVQLNVLDPKVLLEARDHPDRHPWLLVRVSGYSAYFNDLSPAMKQEIIDRTLVRA